MEKNKYYSSLKEIYLDNFRLVRIFIRDYFNDEEIIEEVESIVWLKVLEHEEHVLEMDDYWLKNYLRVIVRNVAFDQIKSEKSIKKLYDELRIIEKGNKPCEAIDSELFKAEKSKYLKVSINTLSHDEKAIIHMKYIEKLSSKEIGERFDISAGAVRMRHLRIMEKLKSEIIRLMKENGDLDI